jgi:DnaD/phage-associated family protein
MNDWFKARNIWGAAFMSLSDAEAGRLAKALWTYTMTGEQLNLSGAEKGIFAMILMTLGQDEQDAADISRKRAVAGSIGGKQTQAKQSMSKQAEANASNCFKKTENKEKEEDKDNNNNGWLTDDEIAESLERDRQIEDMAKRWGLPYSEGHMLKARDLANTYTLDWVLKAIERSGNGEKQTWAYVEGILRNWKQNGGIDNAKKPGKPMKTTSATQYQQREYNDDELEPDWVKGLRNGVTA